MRKGNDTGETKRRHSLSIGSGTYQGEPKKYIEVK